jgi:RNA polymerase sigma factor (sigma-70 family)
VPAPARNGKINRMSSLLHHLRRIALAGQSAGLADGALLDGFVNQRDGACFEALVRRHGPMVLGVCRRILRDHHDAEDAFQATFLVLVRRAATVPPQAVGNWLYGVAYRTALNARRAAARRRARERPEHNMPHPTTEPAEDWVELRPVLDAELSRLPDKYRSAVVLCDLEGLTRAEAAGHLGVPEGTLSGRLTIARRMLAGRLARRGLTLSAGALAALLPQGSAAAIPPPLVEATVRGGQAWLAGSAAGVVSAQVATLADGVATGLAAARWKPLLLVVLAAPLLGAAGAFVPNGRNDGLPEVLAERSVPPATGSATPRPSPPERTDREKLQGTWVLVSEEIDGQPVTDNQRTPIRLVFAGDGVTYRVGDGMQEGTYQLDPTQSPRALDVTLGGQMVIAFIYEVTDTRLTLCWIKGGPRPGGFDTGKGHIGTILYVMEKQ